MPYQTKRKSLLQRIDRTTLAQAVAKSSSLSEVHRRIGLGINGSSYPLLRARLEADGISTSHFLGKRSNKGKPSYNAGRYAYTLEELLVENSRVINTHDLKKRLIKFGLLDEQCAQCNLTEWNDLPAPLELDHINGYRSDNRIENLRLLCPNCHAQTDTYCGKNQARVVKPGNTADSNSVV